MTLQTIIASMSLMAQTRPFFWSEADFQFAFAEALRNNLPSGASIRLERPFQITLTPSSVYYHVDIWVEDGGKFYPIELKYKTSHAIVMNGCEKIVVKDQVAFDEGRYDYVADIKRIEDIKAVCRSANNPYGNCLTFGEGYAIILTNSPEYYDPARKSQNITIDQAFRIYNGNTLSGKLKWVKKTNKNTISSNGDKGSRKVIDLSGSYTMCWRNYSKPINCINNAPFDVQYCVSVIK